MPDTKPKYRTISTVIAVFRGKAIYASMFKTRREAHDWLRKQHNRGYLKVGRILYEVEK